MANMASFITVGEMVDCACTKASALAFHEGLTQEIRHWYGATKVRTRYGSSVCLPDSLIQKF